MAKFMEIIDSLGVGEDGISTLYPETFLTDIRAAYEDDLSIPGAKVDVLAAELAEAQATIAALKAHNYDLMVAAGNGASDDLPDGEGDDTDADDTDTDQGVDALFDDDDN